MISESPIATNMLGCGALPIVPGEDPLFPCEIVSVSRVGGVLHLGLLRKGRFVGEFPAKDTFIAEAITFSASERDRFKRCLEERSSDDGGAR